MDIRRFGWMLRALSKDHPIPTEGLDVQLGRVRPILRERLAEVPSLGEVEVMEVMEVMEGLEGCNVGSQIQMNLLGDTNSVIRYEV